MNIFILHTPLQLLSSQLIVKQYELKLTECILCYEGVPPEGLIDLNIWSQKIYIEFNGSILGSKNSINQTHDQLSKFAHYPGVRIFISDIAWPLNNRIFFSKHFRKCSFIIVSDGIASYTSPGISAKQHIRNLLKCTVGAVGLGSRYTPYSGDMMGMSNRRIEAIYSFRSDLLQKLYKTPVFNIDVSITAGNKLPHTCIFFDQPYRGR
ncbi:MAG: hypothetical protein EB015_15625, partial [Methylocystaceae bacterium]|nr:hypothetical protein [Methylocystaceae bacterium]